MIERKFMQSKGVLVQRTAALRGTSVADALISGALNDSTDKQPLLVVGRLGKIFQFNLCGALLWEALKDSVSVGELTEILVDAFVVLPSHARQSVERLLELLITNKLIVELES